MEWLDHDQAVNCVTYIKPFDGSLNIRNSDTATHPKYISGEINAAVRLHLGAKMGGSFSTRKNILQSCSLDAAEHPVRPLQKESRVRMEQERCMAKQLPQQLLQSKGRNKWLDTDDTSQHSHLL